MPDNADRLWTAGVSLGSLTLADPDLYSSVAWLIDGVGAYAGTTITGSGSSFIVNANDIHYNSIGGHTVYLTVVKDGAPYSKTIVFEIKE